MKGPRKLSMQMIKFEITVLPLISMFHLFLNNYIKF